MSLSSHQKNPATLHVTLRDLTNLFYLDKKICINENKNHKPPLHNYLEKCNFPFYERNSNGEINFCWVGFGNFMFDSIKKNRIDWDQPHIWNER